MLTGTRLQVCRTRVTVLLKNFLTTRNDELMKDWGTQIYPSGCRPVRSVEADPDLDNSSVLV